ncbi:hypothetical protein [Ancylobacter sp. FA202]|uniref:hypothetical protein n=1 Tax=Ancylobacter sp. FA202 TaxID=1111106 RepID=UPI0003790EB2|nr:hypothetical protein [Ancylobacter sp. FA202]
MSATDQADESKDMFFAEIAALAERMIAEHGRDFTMGAFVLAARFIAEKKDLGNRGLETTN